MERPVAKAIHAPSKRYGTGAGGTLSLKNRRETKKFQQRLTTAFNRLTWNFGASRSSMYRQATCHTDQFVRGFLSVGIEDISETISKPRRAVSHTSAKPFASFFKGQIASNSNRLYNL